MSATASKTKCPAAGCAVMKRRSLFLCAAHWRVVPEWMQREIWTYYRNQNWREYFRVAKLAIAHVNELEAAEMGSGGGTGRIENLKLEI
jgi:hypothetical protein